MVVSFVFFFKQKTAYDVRISDGSSDVCSSDLIVVIGGDGTLQGLLTALLRQPDGAVPDLLVIPAGTTNMSAADLGARHKPEPALRALAAWQTGRASCRARVWPNG